MIEIAEIATQFLSFMILGVFVVLCMNLMRRKRGRDRQVRMENDEESQIVDRLAHQADRMERRMDNLETILQPPAHERPTRG